MCKRSKKGGKRTRNNIASIHRILVLDEPESVHELDLGDLTSAMSGEVSFDVGLGSFRGGSGASA